MEQQDVFLALKLLFLPFLYLKGKGVLQLEQWFRYTYKVSFAVAFNSGRSSLSVILKVLNVGKGDEVLLQAFTCVAVPNAVIWQGAKPRYVDIDNSFTMDVLDMEKKITHKTKAIIVQHTFGIPAKMEKIIAIAKKRKIIVIEDCAHGIDYTYQNKKIGTFGDLAFFSFGRDKAISSVFGGMAITNNEVFGKKLRQFEKKQNYPGMFWTFQQLFHPVAFSLILPLYNFFSFGKVILVVLQKLHLLSFPVSQKEKAADKTELFVRKFPNAPSVLALSQLRRIQKFNHARRETAKRYIAEFKSNNLTFSTVVPYLRFPLLVENREYVLSYCRKRNIFLGKWYAEVIDPKGVSLQNVQYKKGMCPKAELFARKIINLPTYPTLEKKQTEKVIEVLKECIQ